MKTFRTVLYVLVIALLLGVFLYSGFTLLKYFNESAHSKETYDSLLDLKEQAAPPVLFPGIHETIPQTPEGEDPTEATEPESNLVTVIHPETGEEVQMLPEFQELFLLNPELVGWITIPGTKLNYPVVQSGTDNVDYYLHRDFYGKRDLHGCIYAREQCDLLEPSDNIILYGHRMNDGSMFACLANYRKQSYWEDNQYIRFDTMVEHGTYQIIAVFKTQATLGDGFAYHLFVDAEDEADFQEFMDRVQELSLYDTGLDAQYGDKLITLSTCDYSRSNGRLVVVAKKVG